MNELDFIQSVKIQGDNLLLNGTMSVPKADGNREYELIKLWLKDNEPEPEFTKEELLKQAKENKKTEINEVSKEAIINGFESDCLGESHTYQSDEQDQLNLIGLVATNLPNFFKCFDGEKWEYKIHTAEQLKQLLIDGGKHKTDILIKAGQLKYAVDIVQTIEEVNQIVWTPNE